MPTKSTPNGFYIFMQAERNRLKDATKSVPSMQDMAALCAVSWKNLSAVEKARYDEIAKEEKLKLRNHPSANKYRLDNHGQIIAERKNAADEDHKRRTLEVHDMVKSWENADILDVKFHLINFQVMYEEDTEDYYLPMEIGLVCFTLREGIINHMHYFIDPGDVPQGNRHIALKHSEETHQIPLCYEKAEQNFLDLLNSIEKFLGDNSQVVDIHPVFCMGSQRKCVESCLEYIHLRAHVRSPSKFNKVYTLEDLVMSLIMRSGKTDQKPSEQQVRDSLLKNQWDYISSLRCSFHDELDCAYCSLAIVRRFSFCVFDLLSNLLNFKLTEQHMPVETSSSSFTIIHPTPYNRDYSNGRGRTSKLTRTKEYKLSTSAISSPARSHCSSISYSTSPDCTLEGAWGGPKISRVEITLSDSDKGSDDEALYSTEDKYSLKELRKPKEPAMVMSQDMSSIITSFGRGVTLQGNKPPTPPVGIAAGQKVDITSRPEVDLVMQPNFGMTTRQDDSRGGGDGPQSAWGRSAFFNEAGRGMPSRPIRPPPGFGPMTSTSQLYSDGFPRLINNLPTRPAGVNHNYIWGIGRSRGMPPQI